jgi:hypothetical protein
LKAFWELAARHWPLSLPRRRLDAAIGCDKVEALLAAGLLARGTLLAEEAVTCLECYGNARLVPEPEGLVAVCVGDMECPVEHFGPEPERVFIDPASFSRNLARALDLENEPSVDGIACPLGRRRLGDELVAFDFVPRPTRNGVEDALHRLVRGGPRVRVILVPSAVRVAAGAPTELGGVDLVWLGLDELLIVGGGPLRLDWQPLLERSSFDGFSPSVPFTGLSIAPDGLWWAGRRIEDEPTPLAMRLLHTLAARPGECIPHAKLWLALWPDKHNRFGNLPKGANPEHFNHGARVLVSELRERLGTATVENKRGAPDTGGYLLALPREMVRLR